MNKKFLIVDGNSILNRAFFGYPQFVNSAGLCLNGVYGFLNILEKHINDFKPTHIAVAFDLPAPTFRHEMYVEYKGTRGEKAPEFKDCFEPLMNILKAMGIQYVGVSGYEGDDVIGTLSTFANENVEVNILSGDKDIFQLINKYVKVRFPKTIDGEKKTIIYDEKRFMEEYNLEPIKLIDLKALMGDTSDNIPGITGIGPKTATKIIKEYGSIENAYAHAEEIKPAKYGKLLKDNFESAKLSKTLATICTSVGGIKFNLESFEFDNIWNENSLKLLDGYEIKKNNGDNCITCYDYFIFSKY